MRLTGTITVEAWIRRSVSGAQHSIAEKYGCAGDAATLGGFAFRVGANDKLVFYTLDDCYGGVGAFGTTTLAANTWYHVAGVWDGAQIRLYVNGALDATVITTHGPKTGGTPLRLGARSNDAGTTFGGVMEDRKSVV